MNKTTFTEILNKRHQLPRWLKITFKTIALLFVLIIVLYLALAFYVNANKDKILVSVTKEINGSLNGKIKAESMDPAFLTGFPRISLRLKNVVLKDSLYEIHKHTLLEAKDFNISINPFAFLRGTIEIRKINISDAKIYLYVDENGYSNSAIFKAKKQKEKDEDGGSFAEIKAVDLHNVIFISDNKKGKKFFNFLINDLNGRIKYDSEGWKANIDLEVLAQSMAFSTKHGSFIKNKIVDGKLDIQYNEEKETIVIVPNDLMIGDDTFNIGAKFNVGNKNTDFAINIKASRILWKNAYNLLSNNISKQLKRFDLEKPIDVSCDIAGDMNAEGDPLIYVQANIQNNRLHVPDGIVDNCNFKGIFTNEFIKGKGFSDPNSAVKLYQFKGEYKEMPFVIDSAFINDFEKPIALAYSSQNFLWQK